MLRAELHLLRQLLGRTPSAKRLASEMGKPLRGRRMKEETSETMDEKSGTGLPVRLLQGLGSAWRQGLRNPDQAIEHASEDQDVEWENRVPVGQSP